MWGDGGRNHVCKIRLLSFKGCGCSARGNFAFSHWLDASPLRNEWLDTGKYWEGLGRVDQHRITDQSVPAKLPGYTSERAERSSAPGWPSVNFTPSATRRLCDAREIVNTAIKTVTEIRHSLQTVTARDALVVTVRQRQDGRHGEWIVWSQRHYAVDAVGRHST